MASRIPTPEQLDVLRDEFRRHTPTMPKDFRSAAKIAGVTESAARFAWSRGFVGVEPLEVQLAKERAIAAQLPEVQRIENNLKRIDLAIAQKLNHELLQLLPVVEKLKEDLLTDALTKGLHLGPEKIVAMLHRLGRVFKDATVVAANAVELRKLVDGEATRIVGHRAMTPDTPLDAEGLERLIEIANRQLEREKAQQENNSDGNAVN